MKQRDVSIDMMKFFAVLAITNSHMELLYGKYSALATGGAIGDVLFFFVSGFTILLGGVKTFDNYYKRRINRIYPTVFAWALVSCMVFGNDRNMVDIILFGGGWFVSCIMIYYVFLFFIRRYLLNRLKLVLTICFLVSALLYFPFAAGDEFNMYGNTYYKWFHYFIFMLQGAMLGLLAKERVVEVRSGWLEFVKVILCVGMFYGLCYFKSSKDYNFVQVLSLLPLSGVTYYVYRLCNAKGLKSLYSDTKAGWYMRAVGGLCLEVYLVQSSLFTDRLNDIYPLNILVVFLEILLVAYILRCVGRIWSQTFRESDYRWKEVFKIV